MNKEFSILFYKTIYYMPYDIRKLPNKDLYRVFNKDTKTIHSYATTMENAKKQIALLEGIKEGKGLTTIDKSSTDVMRINLTDSAKKWLDNKVLPIITETTIYSTDSRKNSGKGRTQVFGYGMVRGKGFGEFKNNSAHPELWNALVHFGMKVVPDYIPWTAIQVNHNYKTKKHIDGNNIGLSLAVSFGDFTGGELVVGDKDYQTKLHPVIFNGALQEHFNRPIKGNRYSLVYFVSAPKKYSDEDIFKLHRKVLDEQRKIGNGLGEPFIVGGSAETDLFETGGVVSIPEFRSVSLDLPTYMFKRLPDMKGKPPPYRYRLVIPITKSRNLSSRKLQTSLNIAQKPVDKPIVNVEEIEDSEKPLLEDFSPDDRVKIQAYYNAVKRNERLRPADIEKDRYEIKQRGLPCYLYENCEKQGLRYKENVKQPKKKKQAKEKMGVILPTETEYERGSKKNRYYDKGLADSPDLFAFLRTGSDKGSDKGSEPSDRTLASKTSTKISKDIVPVERRGVVDEAPAPTAKKARKPRAPRKLDMANVEIQGEEVVDKPAKKPRAPRGSKVAAAVANIEKKKPAPAKKKPVRIEEDDEPLVTEAQQRKAETGSKASSSSLSSIDEEDAKLMETDFNAWLKKNKGKKAGKGLSSIDENKILSNSKMPNKWITYVKEYASKNGMAYKDALKDPNCKAGYKTGSGINKTFHTQDLVAHSYNDSELGANAGKKYISL